jgi:hypothetical protein
MSDEHLVDGKTGGSTRVRLRSTTRSYVCRGRIDPGPTTSGPPSVISIFSPLMDEPGCSKEFVRGVHLRPGRDYTNVFPERGQTPIS